MRRGSGGQATVIWLSTVRFARAIFAKDVLVARVFSLISGVTASEANNLVFVL